MPTSNADGYPAVVQNEYLACQNPLANHEWALQLSDDNPITHCYRCLVGQYESWYHVASDNLGNGENYTPSLRVACQADIVVALCCRLTLGAHPTMVQTLSSHGDWLLRRSLRVVCPDVPALCDVYSPACLCLSGYVLLPGPPGAGYARAIEASSAPVDVASLV